VAFPLREHLSYPEDEIEERVMEMLKMTKGLEAQEGLPKPCPQMEA